MNLSERVWKGRNKNRCQFDWFAWKLRFVFAIRESAITFAQSLHHTSQCNWLSSSEFWISCRNKNHKKRKSSTEKRYFHPTNSFMLSCWLPIKHFHFSCFRFYSTTKIRKNFSSIPFHDLNGWNSLLIWIEQNYPSWSSQNQLKG